MNRAIRKTLHIIINGSFGLAVLIVAVGAQPLVAFEAVALTQLGRVEGVHGAIVPLP